MLKAEPLAGAAPATRAAAGLASKACHFAGREIHALIPHRGDFLFVLSLTVLSPTHFQGVARWRVDQAGIDGHFPGAPIVPAVLLVEAAAQIAGAGLAATNAHAASPDAARVGLMAGIRRCNFSRPVFPGHVVHFDVGIGRASAGFASCSGTFRIQDQAVDAGSFEFVIAVAEADAVFGSHPLKDL